jgi:hypothetical protein
LLGGIYLARKPPQETDPTLPFPAGTGMAPEDARGVRPIWRDSTAQPVLFEPPKTKKTRIELWAAACDFDRRTREPGQHGGCLGPETLRVLHELIFKFWNRLTGQLDPSYAAIAAAANVCVRTVANAIARLKQFGILDWQRRCESFVRDGRRLLAQPTNAYSLRPVAEWIGFFPSLKREPPKPARGTWGDPPRMASVLEEAAAETDYRRKVAVLELGEPDGLEATLARLGRAVAASEAAKA